MIAIIKRNVYIVVLGIFGFVQSQEVLTKQEALNITLENNYDILISRNSVEQADNSQDILNSGYLPTLVGSARSNYIYSSVREGTQSNASIGLNYVLFDGLNRKNTYKRLKESYNISEIQAQQIVENTMITLFTAYYELARLEENERTQSRALAISKERLKRAEYSFEYGQQTRLDVLNAEVDVNSDSINYLDIKRQLANAKRDLNVVLGKEVNTEVNVDTTVQYRTDLMLANLEEYAISRNVELRQAEANINLGELDVKISRSGWMPTVSLSGAYAWSYSNINNAFNPVLGGMNAGVSINWNIFDGGRSSTNVQNAKIGIETAEIQKKQVEEQLKRDLNNAYETYTNLLFTYEVQKKNVETNLRNFERTSEGYKLGQINSIDFRLAQVNLLNAVLARSQAKYNAKLAELQVLRVSGILLDNRVY